MRNIIIIIVLILLAMFLVNNVFAVAPAPYKVICHNNPSQPVTLSFQNEQSYNGHLGTPHNNETFDTDGECEEVEATPTPTPTIDPTPTPEVTQTPTEEPTPTPTETPKNNPTVSSGGSSAPGVCSISDIGNVANIYVVTTGEKGELEVQWSLPSNANQVHIEYGLEQYAQHSLLNTANDGNEVIRGLKSGEHYWFRVAGVRDCGVGAYSSWFDPIVP